MLDLKCKTILSFFGLHITSTLSSLKVNELKGFCIVRYTCTMEWGFLGFRYMQLLSNSTGEIHKDIKRLIDFQLCRVPRFETGNVNLRYVKYSDPKLDLFFISSVCWWAYKGQMDIKRRVTIQDDMKILEILPAELKLPSNFFRAESPRLLLLNDFLGQITSINCEEMYKIIWLFMGEGVFSDLCISTKFHPMPNFEVPTPIY